MADTKEIFSHSEDDTVNAGKQFAEIIKINSAIGLYGDLGSGKTQFVKGICKYFNVIDSVNSPTFIIVNEYNGFDKRSETDIKIYHFDLYRLSNFRQLQEIGFEDYLSPDSNSICLIEWPGIAEKYLKEILIKVYFNYGKDENERILKY